MFRGELLVFHWASPLVADGECSRHMVGTEEIKYAGRIKTSTAALQFEIVKVIIKSLKFKTSCGVGGVPAGLLKSGTEKLY